MTNPDPDEVSPLDSSMSQIPNMEPGTTDFADVEFYETFWLFKLRLSFLDGDVTEAWRLAWGSHPVDDDPGLIAGDVLMTEEQLSGVVDAYHTSQE